ncbi:MAG: diaminopimelate epimerase [Paludibacteraceae bacterium]|nr:diaminopimelate epimerase [Paludibacteraceae bacterium]MBP6284135.1 diaminopimelate epimerase [Paludibacteraceae bacterium]
MSKTIRFTKMQGAGNDYVYINGFEETLISPSTFSTRISDRHFGIGSDGLVLILPSTIADFRMRMFNPDGSEAEMCGNASRCVAKYVYDKKMTSNTEFTLETKAGIKYLTVYTGEDGLVEKVTVDMGEPIFETSLIPALSSEDSIVNETVTIDEKEYAVTAVSMGNPHCVVFTDSTETIELEKIGPKFESHSMFPKKTNTEFVQVINPTTLRMRVWERGTGETLACGTGACATLVAAHINQLCSNKATVELVGGNLEIEWNRDNNRVYMTGPAVTVFEGTIEI